MYATVHIVNAARKKVRAEACLPAMYATVHTVSAARATQEKERAFQVVTFAKERLAAFVYAGAVKT